MRIISNSVLFTVAAIFIQGCNPFESTLDRQIDVCASDVKLGLGDPESLEIVSAREINLDNGWHRVKINYTAKNAMGGRVRGETICGFEGKDVTQLNPDDFMNKERELARRLREIGVR